MCLNEFNINFQNEEQAQEFIVKIIDQIESYGIATLADIIGMFQKPLYYIHNQYYWDKDDIKYFVTEHLADVNCYTVSLTNPRYLGVFDPNDSVPKLKLSSVYGEMRDHENDPQPELLNITIHVNEIDVYDPDEIISSVLKQISQIKDRTVNLTIM